MDGYAATRAIRKGGSRVPVIGLTANAFADEAERCMNAGMDAHVPKPVDWPSLFLMMTRLAKGSGERQSASPITVPESGEQPAVFDLAKLIDLRARIGEQNAAALLRMFEIEAGERFKSEAMQAKTAGAIADEAHGFAGAAAMLGFDELVHACRALEAAAKGNENVDARLELCRAARDRALAVVARQTGNRSAPGQSRALA
jgi:two-component system, sensor histidine kinase and response regulator